MVTRRDPCREGKYCVKDRQDEPADKNRQPSARDVLERRRKRRQARLAVKSWTLAYLEREFLSTPSPASWKPIPSEMPTDATSPAELLLEMLPEKKSLPCPTCGKETPHVARTLSHDETIMVCTACSEIKHCHDCRRETKHTKMLLQEETVIACATCRKVIYCSSCRTEMMHTMSDFSGRKIKICCGCREMRLPGLDARRKEERERENAALTQTA